MTMTNKEFYLVTDVRGLCSYFATEGGEIVESFSKERSYAETMKLLREKVAHGKYSKIYSVSIARECAKISNASIIDHNGWVTILNLLSHVEKVIHLELALTKTIAIKKKKKIIVVPEKLDIFASSEGFLFISHGYIFKNTRLCGLE